MNFYVNSWLRSRYGWGIDHSDLGGYLGNRAVVPVAEDQELVVAYEVALRLGKADVLADDLGLELSKRKGK